MAPAVTPVTNPDTELTLAIDGALLDQRPPVGVVENVVDEPSQSDCVAVVIGLGIWFTVNVALAVQSPPMV